MKILITGVKGYLGSLFYEALRCDYEVIGSSRFGDSLLGIFALDITDKQAVNICFSCLNPDVVIHAAAMPSVGRCEKEPKQAFNTNVEGTQNIVEAANETGAKVIFISSLAALDTSTVYGKSKQLAEQHIRKVRAGYEILQLSMTFGLSPNTSNNRPFNKIISTIQIQSPIIYDNFWRFQPTYTEHVILVIKQILQQGFKGRCLAITTDGTCTMYQIASDVLKPIIIQEAKVYNNRTENFIDPITLLYQGFPTFSYSSMVADLRKQLESFYTKPFV
ncbi:sugar nucleotide-binding protein [Photobacterium piscicola]|uniref:sugar nucleotide-binding protein n=1 Tax=Photobacterium piscicola TaxID=1378299 RepID=UPI003734FECF